MDVCLFAARSEFIRTAIRTSPEQYREEVVQAGFKKCFTIGTHILNVYDLEDVVAEKKAIDLHVVGALTIAQDVTPELALKAIRSVAVYGSFRATEEIKAVLADRIKRLDRAISIL